MTNKFCCIYAHSSTAPNAVEKIWCGSVPYAPQQDITYTPFNKTATVTEGDYELTYSYGPDQQRRKSVLTNTGTGNIEKTIIYAGNYEEVTVNGNTYEVHYIAGGSGLTTINVRTNNGPDELFYVYTDHLGSILKLTDASGTMVYEQNFDAWGRERNTDDWSYTPPLGGPGGVPDWLIRGFTGHEHLSPLGGAGGGSLINMNGRMYDPVIGRMLSPDNFVQNPYNSQVYNRYSYTINNPLRFSDPRGELFFTDDLIVGFVKGFFSTGGGFKNKFNTGIESSMRHFTNSMRIYGGLFAYDPHYSGKGDFWRDVWQVTSRFTWELPQTTVGFFTSHGANTFFNVQEVDYYGGATVLSLNNESMRGSAVTLGSYIIGDEEITTNIEISEGSYTFMHEYGHYRQSQIAGPTYLFKYGFPSARGARWTEHDANLRAANYFREYENFEWNPNFYEPGTYLHRYSFLPEREINPKWWEYSAVILGGAPGGIIVSELNLHRGR